MRKFYSTCWMIAILLLSSIFAEAQNVQSFQLPNGLSVFIWEDSTKNDVHGAIAVKAGSKNDPEQFTGLAHYLEHLMFKGTERIGALDWETEKALYEQIIAKYDERSGISDPIQKAAIDKEINELTIKTSQISVSGEFSSLVSQMGGSNLNAGTSYDYTVYYNSFPANQMEKFLDLYAERLRAPVFRSFQQELETVYEEYNLYEDMLSEKENKFVLTNLFSEHPYKRPIIGYSEHLKNPQISKLIEFYQTWYVPGNMALILCGNVDTEAVKPLIEKAFGVLAAKEVPAKTEYPDWNVVGRQEKSAKLSYLPTMHIAFKGVPMGHPDAIKIEVFSHLLANSDNTGLFDKLILDGDVMYAQAGLLSFTDQGRILFSAVPFYDPNQNTWGSFKSCEKMLMDEVEKVKQGQFDLKTLENIKNNMIRDYTRSLESNMGKASLLYSSFTSGIAYQDALNYPEKVAAITAEDIQKIAAGYCNDNKIVFLIEEEDKKAKVEKLEKPDIQPIEQASGRKSAYALAFEQKPYEQIDLKVVDFNDIKIKPINTRSKLFYTQNSENNIFTLILKYGVGTQKMPYLSYATELMNNAGIMGSYSPQEFKKALAELNVSCSYHVDEDYLYVIMEGFEDNLVESLGLITRQILMPKLDQKQVDNIQGSVIQSRFTETKNPNIIANAFSEYLAYGEKSSYIDRPSVTQVFYEMGLSKLTGEFQRATDYEAEVHYCGNLSFDKAYDIMSRYLPLKATEKESSSPEIRDFVQYDKNTVYFIPNSQTKQAKIYFFAQGNDYNPQNDLLYKAFNRYFGGGGLNGLVMEEIREKNGMAYTTYGYFHTPEVAGKPVSFHGYIGTQSDKAIQAIKLFTSLVNDMPNYVERENTLKTNLALSPYTEQPSFRNMSLVFEEWKRLGYTQSPDLVQKPQIEQFNMQQLIAFYQKELKGKPMAIAIIGDPKSIDAKLLKEFGEVKKISSSRLFSTIE